MPKEIYEVQVGSDTFEVEADSQEQAVGVAKKMARRTVADAGLEQLDAASKEGFRRVREEPLQTAAMIAAPGLIGKMGKIMKPFVSPAVSKLGELIDQPVIGGIMGGAEGYSRTKSARGTLSGAVTGAAGASLMGRGMKALGRIMGPKAVVTPVPGSRVVPGEKLPPLEDELLAALDEVRGTQAPRTLAPSHPSGGGFTTPTPTGVKGARVVPGAKPNSLEDELRAMLQAESAPTSAQVAASHPSGGGFTTPPPTSTTNLGGRLSAGAPAPSMNDELIAALEGTLKQPSGVRVGLGHPSGGGYTVPPTPSLTGPPVSLSPQAQKALARISSPQAAAQVPKATANDTEALFRALASKPILSPEEQLVYEQLNRIMKSRARDTGMSYAAGGKR